MKRRSVTDEPLCTCTRNVFRGAVHFFIRHFKLCTRRYVRVVPSRELCEYSSWDYILQNVGHSSPMANIKVVRSPFIKTLLKKPLSNSLNCCSGVETGDKGSIDAPGAIFRVRHRIITLLSLCTFQSHMMTAEEKIVTYP
ncbi:hypothetical protein AVEN_164738-1 [Araneus ventricosus]|uniref:Uncharacterized protein n=1 Tax=Araneus ventricosus TaxID=182803 RepID=A0A4Y2HJU6_ARAVE|nr:hypothetical protein AVEN_164738-1 [Araneus ventricosus]